ncbi:hypothetical protein [Sphingobacterium suaedae]|uniref:Uncharacterized protein n=1 Tax=Sphingobacterium suaedae TaxID=1686402 RepID=A0ABW5KKK2_9SPHI
MKGRMHKIDIALSTCPQKNRADPKGYVGRQAFIGMVEENLTDTDTKVDEFLGRLIDRDNLNAAYLQLVTEVPMVSIKWV